MKTIIIFLIKTIRILRTSIYRLSCVTKNIAVTNEVGERLRVGDTRDISERSCARIRYSDVVRMSGLL